MGKAEKLEAKIILHKTSCISCKKAISEIQRMKIDIQKRDFFKEPFSESELRKIIKMADMKPKEFIRKRDKMYKELGFETKNYSDDQIIKLMVRFPGLITRPIIITKNKVFTGKSSVESLKSKR